MIYDNHYPSTYLLQRYYRGSLKALENAVTYWTAGQCDAVLNLGDIIDGQCSTKTNSEVDLQSVLDQFRRLRSGVDTLHLIGNHELYNFDRVALRTHLRTARSDGHADAIEREYYSIRF